MLDDFVGGFLKVIWWFFSELFFSTFCYWIGWPLCKMITLGRYPHPGQSAFNEEIGNNNGFICALVGLAVLVGLGLLFIG